ncbi:hypothetical protein HZH68_010123 [Vespula germanica]|uniref:Uncharacterized protein n=1 Tax=Vespula germanica TaxID=30212 RepID=A0A834JWY4_VESGE|nr:hypothetical protein HZH68_010123 [Vespula germanica]
MKIKRETKCRETYNGSVNDLTQLGLVLGQTVTKSQTNQVEGRKNLQELGTSFDTTNDQSSRTESNSFKTLWEGRPPYHTIPYHTTPHHTTPHHITPHHLRPL